MPYTIPSSVISPGAVYQPRQIPAVVSQNARALYYTRGGSTSSSLLLDQSSLNSGTRRTGEEGRCYTADGTDDEVNFGDIGSAIWFSGWVKLNSDNQCLFSLSNDTNTNLIVSAGVLLTGATLTLTGIKIDDVSKTASEAGVLLNDNAWHFLSCGIGDGLGGASTADDVRFFTDGTNHGSVSGFDWRFWSTTPTAAELTEVYSGESPSRNSAALSKYALWAKCDEQSGTTAYDSSGNGNNGTLTNITAATFHSTQPIWSFQNQVGYNTSGAVYIPRDESAPTNDVLGNPLTNTGRRPNDAALHSSNCLTADGTLYIAAAHLAGTETVVSSGGTSTPSISAGRIDFTAGTCWDLTLSDGTHYKLAEGYGTLILDASGSGNHGVLTSATLASAWGGSQDEYHSNLIDGSGKRMYFDGVDNYVSYSTNPIPVGDIEMEATFVAYSNSGTSYIFGTQSSGSNGNRYLRVNSGNIQFEVWGSAGAFFVNHSIVVNQKYTVKGRLNLTDNQLELYVDGVLKDTTAVTGTFNTVHSNFVVGARPDNKNNIFTGIIYDLVVRDSVQTQVFNANGYGNTDADWIDQIGSNNGTVNGSPEAFYIPAAPNGLDVFGNELTEKPSDAARNRAETLIDIDPDSTPEMGSTQLGITVPASHAFGDAFAASTQIFSRQRTLTEDRFVVMPEAQTGSALATIQRYTQP